ncbi:type II secretion system protein GspN [Bdellovibrio sp. qaytius]|nr:type II secretion system protein GspN [Bdellovibrio sp. qaytius]
MMDMIIKTFRFVWSQKFRILFTVVFALVFLFILFPFKDLNDFVSGQVSNLTQNSVYLQFEDMHMNPLTTSISLDGVLVETSTIDGLNINSISASPSIAALFKRQPGGKIVAEGFFGGHAEVKLTPLATLESGALKANLDVTTENISLKSLRDTLKIQIPLSGAMNINASVTADMSFKEQPDGDVAIVIDNFEMPGTSINSPNFGSIALPEIKFKQIDVKGKLAGGKLVIENAKLGNPADDLSGTLKGDIAISIQNIGGTARPILGGYNFNIDLIAKPAFVQRAQFFLSFIDQYKKEEKGSSRYRLKLQAASTELPPSILPLN